MNKDSIYQLIGYQGEYNNNIKKEIKKLLKENHPDHNGDANLFKLINEVKKELDTNKVTYKFNQNNKNNNINDIDYNFCYEMINRLEKDIKNINNEINNEQIFINTLKHRYNNLYQDSLNNENILLYIDENKRKLKKIKKYSLILLVVLIILFVMIIFNKNIYILIFLLLIGIVLFYNIIKFFNIVSKLTMHNELKIKTYMDLINSIKIIQNEKIIHEHRLLELKEKKNRISNNLRFYKNLLKNK